MGDAYDAWMHEMLKDYSTEIDQLKAELEQVKKERDEARRLHSVLHDVASGGCLHTLLKHEHACAVDSINMYRRELSEARVRIEDLENQVTAGFEGKHVDWDDGEYNDG